MKRNYAPPFRLAEPVAPDRQYFPNKKPRPVWVRGVSTEGEEPQRFFELR